MKYFMSLIEQLIVSKQTPLPQSNPNDPFFKKKEPNKNTFAN